MKWDLEKPCGSCPYRVDSPLGLWHRAEFEKVLAAERDLIGKVFLCHGDAKKPREDARPCAGWLIDQRERRMPSLALRMAVSSGREKARDLVERLHDGGDELYLSVGVMCRENGVDPGDVP